MTIARILRITGLVAAVALPFGPESGSAAEPDASLVPAPVEPGPAVETGEVEQPSHVVLQLPGQTPGDLSRDFVVLAGRDGRVPRAWLWDEPLGCPQAPRRSARSASERSRGQSASP